MAERSPVIDLNADVGEGFGRWTAGDDEELLRVVSSANVACGFHAGDPSIMRRTCERAAALGVRIGAHVGYRDLAGFGRRPLDVDPDELRDEVVYQVGALEACARAAGVTVSHVKPHGALYHRCSGDSEAARALVDAVVAVDARLAVVGAPGSELLRHAEVAGLPAIPEGFADRGYGSDGGLLGRSQPGAVLGPEEAAAQAVAIARDRAVVAADGTTLAVDVRTLCVHGDTPGAAAVAGAVREALERAGVTVAPVT